MRYGNYWSYFNFDQTAHFTVILDRSSCSLNPQFSAKNVVHLQILPGHLPLSTRGWTSHQCVATVNDISFYPQSAAISRYDGPGSPHVLTIEDWLFVSSLCVFSETSCFVSTVSGDSIVAIDSTSSTDFDLIRSIYNVGKALYAGRRHIACWCISAFLKCLLHKCNFFCTLSSTDEKRFTKSSHFFLRLPSLGNEKKDNPKPLSRELLPQMQHFRVVFGIFWYKLTGTCQGELSDEFALRRSQCVVTNSSLGDIWCL